jgi:hypothetical protein
MQAGAATTSACFIFPYALNNHSLILSLFFIAAHGSVDSQSAPLS